MEPARESYSQKVSEGYHFLFGKDSFSAPGNAASVGGKFIQPAAFPSASYGAHCHQEAYRQ
jgi:hypothetical protein